MAKEKAAAYIRVSSQEQKLHGLSLDAQRMKLKDYADSHGIEIVAWYADEGVSGRKPIAKRPHLQQLINDAQAGTFSRILFIKLDRFFRSVKEYYRAMELLHDMPWTATEEQYDMTTANGRMLVNMKLTIAQLEAEQTGERLKIVYDYKAKAGIPMNGTNNLPFCYANPPVEPGQRRRIVKRNEEAFLFILESVETHGSVRKAVFDVQARYGLDIGYNGVYRALRNPLICGQYRDNPNFCDPYISRERFDALQEKLTHNINDYGRRAYLFSGLLLCPHCGNKLTALQTGPSPYHYSAYRCCKRNKSHGCDYSTVIMERRLETTMLQYVEDYFALFDVSATQKPTWQKKIDVSALRSELSRVNYAFEKGRLTEKEYDDKYESLLARINAAEKYNSHLSAVPKIMQSFSSDWRSTYEELSLEGRRSFWHSFVKAIHVDWESGPASPKSISAIEWL